MANDIVDAEKKRAVFLSEVGPATYKLLGDLLAPASPETSHMITGRGGNESL